ncbi:MAG: uracil-DNA glycosylase [Candidatus Eremiobacteraeota bacterium]|nr:uracil-DNA glycosylase [Candidatus Eremiobacteraeota bacterium]MBC5803419.1 uracil-DNA glycosylase [Candidatus Eremiobacteraeota bacterium]MBC5821981.1 uracil-DNA glycosylase [Candidatus Eremiobacteraeota bacterium]
MPRSQSSASPASLEAAFAARAARVIACERCPELRAYCARIAMEKKREHRDADYWGRPVPAFGDPRARVLLVGLAPGAHGSNRTGRPFTGDASGEWLYRALYRAGFANQPTARDRGDGLELRDALVTAALRCAPPKNKPTPTQLLRCFPYLLDELSALESLRVVIGLGAIGWRAGASALRAAGYAFEGRPLFAHGAEALARGGSRPSVTLLASYHPSRQNTNTGVLSEVMLDAVFARASELVTPA